MAKAKWSFESAKDIRNDVRDEYINCVREVMCDDYPDEYKVHLFEGMMMLYDRLKPYMEETEDEENVQNS